MTEHLPSACDFLAPTRFEERGDALAGRAAGHQHGPVHRRADRLDRLLPLALRHQVDLVEEDDLGLGRQRL